jgi:multidrug resistance efflux pump
MPLDRILRSRFARLTLAFLLIALSVWAFVPYLVYHIAASAFINADLIRVTAPLTGKLTESIPHRGIYLERPVAVSLIEAISPNRANVHELERQYTLARESSELIKRHLQDISAADLALAKRLEIYSDARLRRLQSEISQLTAEKDGCFAELKQRRVVGSRLEALMKSGLASEIRSAEALATQEAASARCEIVALRLEGLQVELAAAREGLFLTDGANDVPYSQQQRERLTLRRQELEAQVLREDLASANLAVALAAERDRMKTASQYQVVLPAEHVVWSVEGSPGGTIAEGQTILSLANCAHRFVAVELPERNFDQIKTGEAALVRLIGQQTWQEGLVQQVQGSVARSENRLLAAQMPGASPGMITVELSLPATAPAAGGSTYCDIGRLAEVRFERSLPGIFHTVANGWRNLAETLQLLTRLGSA